MIQGVLKGKVAIVTGSTRGIGKGIALEFVKQGASVAIIGTNDELGKQVVEELQAIAIEGAWVEFFKTDVGNSESVEETMGAIFSKQDKVDILVNNAGITKDGLILRMSEEQWDDVIRINLKSAFLFSKIFVKKMMKHGGKIINVSSVSGIAGMAGQTNYAASKAGMIGFSKSLSKEMGARGFYVNCIAPGFIDTDMTAFLDDEKKKVLIEKISLRRTGLTQDIANVALFLSSYLSDYITGQVIAVDGGLII